MAARIRVSKPATSSEGALEEGVAAEGLGEHEDVSEVRVSGSIEQGDELRPASSAGLARRSDDRNDGMAPTAMAIENIGIARVRVGARRPR